MNGKSKRLSLTPGRFRVLALMAAGLACLFVVWYSFVNLYRALGYGLYHTRVYWNLWPIALLFLGVNAVIRLYHGNVLYPAMPHFIKYLGGIL